MKTPIRESSNKPILFMNGDRELVLMSALLCFVLVFIVQSWFAFFMGVLAWFFSLMLLRKMAKHDAVLRHVYLRHISYKKYYPARSTPFTDKPNKRVTKDLK